MTLDGEIHARITAHNLWQDPAWQTIHDWNHHIYQRTKDTTP